MIGVDPGPRPGIVGLRYTQRTFGDKPDLLWVPSAAPIIIQCSGNAAMLLLRAILPRDVKRILLSYEPFVASNRLPKVAGAAASAATAKMCGYIAGEAAGDPRIVLKHYRASDVKPWAFDERLERTGLLPLVTGMVHARDAARQALYCACHDGGVPDPLSKKHRRMEIPA